MADNGQWIANCKQDRVERISAASIYVLHVGPPVPNQLQTLEKLQDEGFVGLYRTVKKEDLIARRDQDNYLNSSEFVPSPESLRSLLGSLAILRGR